MSIKWNEALGLWMPEMDTHFTARTFELSHLFPLLSYGQLREGDLVIDGGAHVGAWVKEFIRLGLNVWAFEPDPSNYEALVRNMGGEKGVAINAALGEEAGRAALHPPVNPGNSGARWLVEGDEVDVVTLDSFELRPRAIKLDVEGYEPQALRGAAKTIEKYRPVVLVEQKPITAHYGKPFDAAGKLLESWGYALAAQFNKDYIYVPV